LIDINDEDLVIISDKHRAPAARRQNSPHLHFDHRFVHQMDGSCPRMKNKQRRIMCSLTRWQNGVEAA